MRTSILVVLLAVAVVFLLPTTASAQGGEPVGACLGLDFLDGSDPGFGLDPGAGEESDACIDGVTEEFCDEICGSALFQKCFWDSGALCTDQQIDWDGSCAGKGLCILIDTDIPGASQALCEGLGATWFPGDTTCGGAPVPALPKIAYGVLALVLLAGTLTLLTFYSRS